MDTRGLLIALAVALVTTLPVVFVVLRNWLAGWSLSTKRTVRIELDGEVFELTNASEEEQSALIEAYLKRHVPVDGGDDDRDR